MRELSVSKKFLGPINGNEGKDWLKTKAPFWKLEETSEGGRWVEAKTKDDIATARWEK